MATTSVEVAVIDAGDPWAKFASSKPAEPPPSRVADQKTPSSAPTTAAATVEVDDLTFHYPDIGTNDLHNAPTSMTNNRWTPHRRRATSGAAHDLLPPCWRPRTAHRCVYKDAVVVPCTLSAGPNGAGKTTLLKILGGKHMVSESALKVMGQPPFHATQLTTSGALSYIGGNWERDVAFAGYAVPLQGDIPAGQMLASVPDVDPARRQRLIDVLDINPQWRMHHVSDGQRRRVQLAMGLLREFKVLLLDEITVDLDVLGRADLMAFLVEETTQRNATIIYVRLVNSWCE